MFTQTMSVLEKIKALETLTGGEVAQVLTMNEKEALKKSRLTKLPTPENLAKIFIVRDRLLRIGGEPGTYAGIINDRRLEEAKEADFQAQGTYSEEYTANGIVRKHKEREQFYLRGYVNDCKQVGKTRYFDANGVEMSEEMFRKIEAEYLPLPGKNKSQGLDNSLIVNDFKLENVLRVKRGSDGFDATPPVVRALLATESEVA